ncbi:MAG: hypothetical protein F4Z35_06580 [Dehalococcoidia bacterium]|nr:hypothetical protein [Dehalococcoidia bacterium]
MATIISVHGDYAEDIAAYLRTLEILGDEKVNLRSVGESHHVTADFGELIVTDENRVAPHNPVIWEQMETLRRYGDTCEACAYLRAALRIIATVGKEEALCALFQLIELHDFDCWGNPEEDEEEVA